MTASIHVRPSAPGRFQVTVTEGASQTKHAVFLAAPYYEKLAGGKVPEKVLIEESFRFLLEREPKESILREFDLSVIARYFPVYESEIRKRWAK